MPSRGFTLVEALVAIGVFLLIVIGVAELLLYSLKSRDVVWEQLSTQNEGRKIAQDFVNELRSANVSSIGAYTIETAQSNQIIFYSNLDADSWRERVRYFLDGNILKKGVVKPTGTPLTYHLDDEVITEVAHDVANTSTPLFYYYGENYDGVVNTAPLATPVNVISIRAVGINLMLEENPQLSPAPLDVEAKAQIRNLKTN